MDVIATEVCVPKFNSNDSAYILIEWLVDQGQFVGDGDPLVVLETSKAAEEIASPRAGVVRRIVAAGSECQPGQVLCEVVDPADVTGRGEPALEVVRNAVSPAVAGTDAVLAPVLTKPARLLAERYGVTREELADLGKRIVSAEDIERLRAEATDAPGSSEKGTGAADPASTGTLFQVSRTQQHVAQRVSASHESIPAAFTVVKVQLDALIAQTESMARTLKIFIGMPEFLVKVTGMMHAEFPIFFSRPDDDKPLEQLVLAPSADIGLAIDVGTGLYVPVIRRVDQLSVREITQEFMKARVGVLRGRVGVQHRGSPSFVIAMSNEPDVVMSVPLIFPGTVATLVLAGLQEEAWVGPDDKLLNRKFTYLGLAYDHRYINGRDCIAFLRRLKTLLEAPMSILADGGPT